MTASHDCSTTLGARLLLRLTGFLALVWFLIRVIPRPSRAAYPCQQAAFPLASAFVLWVVGTLASWRLLGRSRTLFADRRRAAALACVALAVIVGGAAWLWQPSTPALADPHPVLDPVGVPRGIHPGRVVWYHDPDATDWAGPGDGHWWEPAHTDQAVVEEMLTRCVEELTTEPVPADAWNALIRHHNLAHGRGDVGYAPGEKIAVKVNLVGCHYIPGWGGTDAESYDLTSYLDYMNTSPQVMLALLRGLVNELGAAQSDITIGDPLALFPNQYHAMLAGEFPDVNYLDHQGGTPEHPRRQARDSDVPLYWSTDTSGYLQDHVPVSYAEANYLVNLANFKSHSLAGVTLCAKNHYGSFVRYPVEDGYFGLHQSLAARTPDEGSYRALVDLMGHAHLGGKTVLHLVDGLYAGSHPYDLSPLIWDAAPFDGDWTSSLFASQDPVALESVCLDLMQLEGDPRLYPQMAGADDYLHEAALAHAPPSGTFYDPDHPGDVQRLASLGVHEHWADQVSMQYSGNLDPGTGIELRRLVSTTAVPAAGRLAAACRPNPFNPRTEIRFELPVPGRVRLEVFDLSGARVAVLLDETREAGFHAVPWTAHDDAGRALPSGAYVYRLRQGTLSVSGKMSLVR